MSQDTVCYSGQSFIFDVHGISTILMHLHTAFYVFDLHGTFTVWWTDGQRDRCRPFTVLPVFSHSCFVLQSRYNSPLLSLTLCLSLDEFQMGFLHPWNKSVQLNRFTEDPLKRLLANGACDRSNSEVYRPIRDLTWN